jgi:hypothetical protein
MSNLLYFGEMPADKYHASHDFNSRSMIVDFIEDPEIYAAKYISKLIDSWEKPTAAMEIGDLTHTAVLEPDKIEHNYVFYPDSVLSKSGGTNTNAARDFAEEHRANGKTVLKKGQYSIVKRIAESARKKFGSLLSLPSIREYAIFWKDESTGLQLRCRPDLLIVANGVCYCFDIKTTQSIKRADFKSSSEKYFYWLQQAHYIEGVLEAIKDGKIDAKEVVFKFLAVESTFLHRTRMFNISKQSYEKSREYWRNTIDRLAECIGTGNFGEAESDDIVEIDIGDWCFGK